MNDLVDEEHSQWIRLMLSGGAGAPRRDRMKICGVCGNTIESEDRNFYRLAKADDSVPWDFFNPVFLTWVAHVSCLQAIAVAGTEQARAEPMARLSVVEGMGDAECPICYEDDGSKKFAKSACGHVAHEECWRAWFSTGAQSRCVVCRAVL